MPDSPFGTVGTPASAPAAAPSSAPKAPAAAPTGAAEKIVNSPLSGTVFKVLVKVGDSVDVNQDLLILEAMKMETNIVAAMAGTIKNVAVAEGEAVTQGQFLIEFE